MSKPEISQSLKISLENSKAEYVRLGKSGLSVSIPILGAMSIGDPKCLPWVTAEEEVAIPSFPIPLLPILLPIPLCPLNSIHHLRMQTQC